jgi:hypothetical protein
MKLDEQRSDLDAQVIAVQKAIFFLCVVVAGAALAWNASPELEDRGETYSNELDGLHEAQVFHYRKFREQTFAENAPAGRQRVRPSTERQ